MIYSHMSLPMAHAVVSRMPVIPLAAVCQVKLYDDFAISGSPQPEVEVPPTPHRSFFDKAHHYEVWKARKAQGLWLMRNVDVPQHPLVGKKFTVKYNSTSKEVTIQSVHLDWFDGEYLVSILYVDKNDSHGLRRIGSFQAPFRGIEDIRAWACMINKIPHDENTNI